MMRTHTLSLAVIALLCLLLVTGVVAAQSGEPTAQYIVASGVASGGGYRLTGLVWRVQGLAAGGGYLLTVPASPRLRGNGCCCTYLPCVLRHSP